jgi:hypothetical protein
VARGTRVLESIIAFLDDKMFHSRKNNWSPISHKQRRYLSVSLPGNRFNTSFCLRVSQDEKWALSSTLVYAHVILLAGSEMIDYS